MYDNTKTVEAILNCANTTDIPEFVRGITAILNYHNKEVIYEHFEDRNANFLLFLDDAEVRWLNGEAKGILTINEQLPMLNEEEEKHYTALFNCTQAYVLEKDAEGEKVASDSEEEEREFFVYQNGEYELAKKDMPDRPYFLYDGDDTINDLVDFMGKVNTMRFLNAIM